MDKLYDCFSSPFYQPVGAAADLKELEYISALLQTGKVLRSDGSLTAEDVAHYLLSRHEIHVTPECIKNTIFQVFGVGNMENGGRLDLLELTAMLIIPILLIMREQLISSEGRSSVRVSAALGQGATQTQCPQQQQQQQLLEDPKGILRDVLSMMCIDSRIPLSPGEFTPPRLTEGLVQQILRSYGMHNLADDSNFIREMIISAQGHTSVDNFFLDEVVFVQALTSDVMMFKTDSCDVNDLMLLQSSPTDQISKGRPKDSRNALNLNEDEEEGESNISSASWQKVFTAKVIDFTSDNYTSVIFVVCLWVYFFLFFIAYLDIFVYGYVSTCKTNSAGCRILNLVVSLIAQAITLMVSGLIFIGLGSVVFIELIIPFISSLLGIFGIAIVGIFTIFTFFYHFQWWIFNTLSSHSEYDLARYFILCLGCLLIFLQMLHLVSAKGQMLQRFTESKYNAEKRSYQAAVFKLGRLLQNAQNMHNSWKNARELGGSLTCFGSAFLAFSKKSQSSEKFSLSNVFNGKFFREEGIWLSSRLLSGVVLQLVAVFFFSLFASYLYHEDITRYVISPPYNCSLHDESYYVSKYCAFDSVASCYANCTQSLGIILMDTFNKKDTCRLDCIKNCDPCSTAPPWLFKLPWIVSLCITGSGLGLQSLNYVPSYIKTTLKFRTGIHQSLGDTIFEDYRNKSAFDGNLLGAMFFSVVASGLIITGVLVSIIAVLVSPVYRDVVISLLILVAGVAIFIVILVCLLIPFKLKCFANFYRVHPAVANIVGLMLECYQIISTTFFIIIRAVALIFTAAFYIGRIDVPMLYTDGHVGFVDQHPMIFRVDILAHEAHRHPYIETMGLVSLYKLRYRDFANAAGSTWRVLFVMSLFPWLRKYCFRRNYVEPELARDILDENDELKSSILLLQQENDELKASILLLQQDMKFNTEKKL